MSEKCSGCGYYTGACQCRVDDNRCRSCGKILSACTCDVNHTDHWSYDNPNTYKFQDDNPCNGDECHSGSEDWWRKINSIIIMKFKCYSIINYYY